MSLATASLGGPSAGPGEAAAAPVADSHDPDQVLFPMQLPPSEYCRECWGTHRRPYGPCRSCSPPNPTAP